MPSSELATYFSLALAVLFWLLSSKQANDAKNTLNEVKSAIISWQSDLNKATINIISSSPEIIAKESAMAETQSMSDFSSRLTKLIEDSALSDSNENSEYKLKVLDKLLEHHKNLILGKQQLMAQAFQSQQATHQPESTKTK